MLKYIMLFFYSKKEREQERDIKIRNRNEFKDRQRENVIEIFSQFHEERDKEGGREREMEEREIDL